MLQLPRRVEELRQHFMQGLSTGSTFRVHLSALTPFYVGAPDGDLRRAGTAGLTAGRRAVV